MLKYKKSPLTKQTNHITHNSPDKLSHPYVLIKNNLAIAIDTYLIQPYTSTIAAGVNVLAKSTLSNNKVCGVLTSNTFHKGAVNNMLTPKIFP